MAKIFVVSLAEAPLNDGRIAGRVHSITDDTETVVTDADSLLAALRNAPAPAPSDD
jgi:hypothetical protein